MRPDGGPAARGPLGPGQRWSTARKREVVLRLWRGESLDALSRELGVELYRLEQWRERALAGMDLGLKDRTGEALESELDAAKRHIGELSMENELLRERARAAEARLPLAMRRSRR
ncbi:MAG: IS3 family transposase [bacterium]